MLARRLAASEIIGSKHPKAEKRRRRRRSTRDPHHERRLFLPDLPRT
jgi:hypothetical protein